MLYTFLRRSFRVAAAMSICVDAVTDWFQEVRISFEKVCVVVESRVELADLVMELTSCTDVIMILRGSYATRHSCNHASKSPRRCKFYQYHLYEKTICHFEFLHVFIYVVKSHCVDAYGLNAIACR
jgi:hypothetical protein